MMHARVDAQQAARTTLMIVSAQASKEGATDTPQVGGLISLNEHMKGLTRTCEKQNTLQITDYRAERQQVIV